MARNGKLGPEQKQQIIESYKAGVPLKKIAKQFGIAECTVSYHVTRAGVPRRASKYRNTASMCVLSGEPMRRCLNCGRMFRPYTYNWSLYRNICWDCWQENGEHDHIPENPIGRRV